MTLQNYYYRELSVAEILSKSFRLYVARFEYFLFPFLLTNMASGIIGQFMENFIPPFDLPKNLSEEFFLWLINYVTAAVPVAIMVFVLGWTLSTISNGIAVKYFQDLLERRKTSIKEEADFTISRISSLLASGLITGSLMALGFILFIVPGIIMAIAFSLAVQVIMIERLGVFESFRRSRKLVANRWSKTAAVLFSIFSIIIMASLVGYVIGDLFGPLKRLIALTVISLFQPLHPISLTYLYYSLRIREKPAEPPAYLQPTIPFVPSPIPQPSPAPTFFQPKFCYKCGQKLPSEAIFCPECGRRVKF